MTEIDKELQELRRTNEKLKRGIENLSKIIEQAYKERDAAVAGLTALARGARYPCKSCANHFGDEPEECFTCNNERLNGNFRWRGINDDNSNTE